VELKRPCESFEPLGRLFSSTPIPAVLQTCREAQIQRLYTQVFFEVNVQLGAVGHLYVGLNYDMDMVDIGTSFSRHFEHIASDIKWLKFELKNSDEFWYRVDCKHLANFVNVKEIHVICTDGFCDWDGSINEGNHPWPCPVEDLVFMEKFGDGQIARGLELEEYVNRLRISLSNDNFRAIRFLHEE
jgi:hypothetical protein